MISNQQAADLLVQETMDREYALDRWVGTTFQQFKFMSTTEKGDIGEDFLAKLLVADGYINAEVHQGRRGHYDVKVAINGKDIKFEVKVATQDVSGSHQFNGIRYDTQYTHLFCLGITPDEIKFVIIAKQELGSGEHTMVSMARGSNASFKLTKKTDDLLDFDAFSYRVKQLGE